MDSTAFVTDGNATVTQGFLYAPFGEIISEYQGIAPTSALPKYTFNAKELDEETGMYYYEARYYNPPVFTSRDPMFEKYFWMSPYAYCANNPVKYVDPSGETIEIIGEEQQAAFKEFKKGARQYGIKAKMNRYGIISGKYVGKGEISKEGEQIMNAITDVSVRVIINSTSANETEGGYSFFGGAFLGNKLKPIKVGKDDIVGYKSITKQDVNPYDLRAMSEYYGKPGQDMLHEVTEAYEGGLLSLKLCKSITNSLNDKFTYEYVHNKAIPQSGNVKQNILLDYEDGPQIGWRWIIGSYEKDWILPQYR